MKPFESNNLEWQITFSFSISDTYKVYSYKRNNVLLK